MFKLIQDYRVTPWKNGKGESTEIAIFPEKASFAADPFLWRLSSAKVLEEGEFSYFPEYDRYLTLFKGPFLDISIGDQPPYRMSPGKVLLFRGEEKVFARPAPGGVVDLNLIFRRSIIKARFHLLDLTDRSPHLYSFSAKWSFIFGVFSSTVIRAHLGSKVEIHEGQTLLVSELNSSMESRFQFTAQQGSSKIAIIELDG